MAVNDRPCPVLTDIGKQLIAENIKDALHEIIVYGVPKNDLQGKEQLHALLQSDKATKEQLESFKIIEKKPLVSFFDIDKKLTVRINLSYEDLIRKDVTIEGIGILSKNGDIVSLFPDYAILDNPQANLEALIKIHSVVGEPGTVEYYTGTYLTREEYEAAKVPMVNEVFNRTNAIVEPKIKQVVNDFKATGTQILEAHKDNFELIKAQYARELEEIKIQATQDLTGIQDYISKLHRLGRFEQASIHMYDRLCHLYKNLYNMFQESIDLFKKAKEEESQFGTLGIFSNELPKGYIYFNTWYPIKDYLCFYKTYGLYKVDNVDRSKFMIRWEPRTASKPNNPLSSLYIKVALDDRPQKVLKNNPQQLPNPFKYVYIGNRTSTVKLTCAGGTYWYEGMSYNERFKGTSTHGTVQRNWSDSGDAPHYITTPFRVSVEDIAQAFDNIQNAINSIPTYDNDMGSNVEVENTMFLLGLKANLSFNIKEELGKIMDRAFVDC